MSNFDHQIDGNVAKEIKGKPLYAGYPGWNFHGLVWWQNESWFCEIKVYGHYKETIQANDLDQLMKSVCFKYGND